MAKTESECRKLLEAAQDEKDNMLSEAREKVTSIRGSMKRECESVSTYMASLMESVEGVVKACQETKTISDKVFGGIEKQPDRPALTAGDEEEIPQIKFQ
jgi:vacuolar-type H+-ATPase subunit H